MTACTLMRWLPAAAGTCDCLHFNAGYALPELEFPSLVT